MVVKFYDYTCLTKITNTDYEGEIRKQGDTVIIRSIPDITIEDHNIGDKITYTRPSSPSITMLIDKGKRMAIELDDVIKVQTDLPLLNKWTDDGSMQMKISIETSFFNDSTVYAGMAATNTGLTAGRVSASYNIGTTAAPVTLTKDNILDYSVDTGSVLDEQNIPEVGRWLVLPTWAIGMIKKSDIKDASLTNDSVSVLRNGRIGTVDRFEVFSSNLLYHSGTSYYVGLFGTTAAISFATQLTNTEAMRSPDSFADRVRGLQVYGYKVVKPEAYGALVCKK